MCIDVVKSQGVGSLFVVGYFFISYWFYFVNLNYNTLVVYTLVGNMTSCEMFMYVSWFFICHLEKFGEVKLKGLVRTVQIFLFVRRSQI